MYRWLNWKGNSQQDNKLLEDPSEDVFLANVGTKSGNFRIFTGLWTYSDCHLEAFISCLDELELPEPLYSKIWKPTIGLLTLSETLAERLNLDRWTSDSSEPGQSINLPPENELKKHLRALVFSPSDLSDLNIEDTQLEPFTLPIDNNSIASAKSETTTYLEKTPLIHTGGHVYLISPHDISPAIRHLIISKLSESGHINKFLNVISRYHSSQIQERIVRTLDYDPTMMNVPDPNAQIPSLSSWLVRYDSDKAIHIVLLHENLSKISTGLDSKMGYSARENQSLHQFFSTVTKYSLEDLECHEGFTLIVAGGVGRSIEIPNYEGHQNWHISIVNLFDLLLLSDREDESVDLYLKFVRYRHELELSNAHFPTPWTDFDLFSYWINNDHSLIDRGTYIRDFNWIVTPLWALKVRIECRVAADRHVATSIDGDHHRIKRFAINSSFESRSSVPTYVSLDSLADRRLSGLSITDRGIYWLRATGCHQSGPLREIEFRIWEGVLDLLFTIKSHIDECIADSFKPPIEIQFDFSSMTWPGDGLSVGSETVPTFSCVDVDTDQRIVQLRFHEGALTNAMNPSDLFDREILTKLIAGLLCFYQYDDTSSIESRSVQICSKLFGNRQMRFVHLFPGDSRASVIGGELPDPFLVRKEDLAIARQTMSHNTELRQYANSKFETVDECNRFLRSVVDYYWGEIKATLNRTDRSSLIPELLKLHDSISEDRLWWRISARSMVGIYGSEEEPVHVAQARERRRAQTSVSVRTLLEMAICECPYISTQEVPQSVVERLIALSSLMLETATCSDAIFTGLVESKIEVASDLSYSMPRQFYRDVLSRFVSAQFTSEFRADVEEYERWYEGLSIDGSTDHLPCGLSECSDALRHEFGLSLKEMLSGVTALNSFAHEFGQDIVSSSIGDLMKWLHEDHRYSSDIVMSLLSSLGIFHRNQWDSPPEGFSMKDILPWRYNRRLSFVFRPILIDGLTPESRLYYIANRIAMGLALLIDRLTEGHFPQEFASSEEMRSYLGRVDFQKGSEFEDQVAAEFESTDWHVRKRVAMSEFGSNVDLGDVDVLAWRSSGLLMVVECKRLKLARTVKEIAETCQRFATDESGQARKHAARVAWIRRYPDGVCAITGLDSGGLRIRPRFVTSVEVPMKYLDELPQDIGDVGPLTAEELAAE